eukprot:scaffold33273_cov62-Phaeocystis_antarctica.AAC.4
MNHEESRYEPDESSLRSRVSREGMKPSEAMYGKNMAPMSRKKVAATPEPVEESAHQEAVAEVEHVSLPRPERARPPGHAHGSMQQHAQLPAPGRLAEPRAAQRGPTHRGGRWGAARRLGLGVASCTRGECPVGRAAERALVEPLGNEEVHYPVGVIPACDDPRCLVAALGAQRDEGVGGVGSRAVVDEHAAVEQEQRVEGGEDLGARLVDGAHDRDAALVGEVPQRLGHDERDGRVEAAGWLIAHEQRWLRDQLGPDAQPLSLAARHSTSLHDRRVANYGVGAGIESQHGQDIGDTSLALRGCRRGWHAERSGVCEGLTDAQGALHDIVLVDECHALLEILAPRLAVVEHIATSHRASSRDRSEECGLAGARGPHERVKRSGSEGSVARSQTSLVLNSQAEAFPGHRQALDGLRVASLAHVSGGKGR